MQNPWDLNAKERHKQILEGKDISFSKVLVPEIIESLRSQDSHESFCVLDVGCGTGILAHILSEYVLQIVGIDPSLESVLIAQEYNKEKRNVTIECISIENFANGRPNWFDFVVVNMGLQAIEPLLPALRNIWHLLKQQGVFIFSIPHPCFWAFYRKEVSDFGYNYPVPSSHQISFIVTNDPNPLPGRVPYFHRSLEIYSSALEEAGFVIEKIREPFPSPDIMQRYTRHWTFPRFLIAVCRKKSTPKAQHHEE